MSGLFLIEKRGLYYRPEAQGYTGLKREAGRYSFEEAAERVGPNGPDGPQDGMGMWREEEAPEFSSACAWDLKLMERTRQQALKDAVQAFSHLDLPPTDEGDEFEDGWIAAENAIREAIEKIIEGKPA